MLNCKHNGKKIGISNLSVSQWRITNRRTISCVTLSEYSESFSAHQMTVLSCSMTGTCQTTTPPPSPLSSCPPLPTQLLGSSQWSWTVIDAVESPRDQDLSRLSAPAPCVEGSWIGQLSEKVSRGRKNLVQLTYPTKDSISLHCATPHPLLAPGTSWSQPPQLPGKNIPLQRCDGSSQRGWTVIELEVVLITAHAHTLLRCLGWYNMLTPLSLNISKNRHEISRLGRIRG